MYKFSALYCYIYPQMEILCVALYTSVCEQCNNNTDLINIMLSETYLMTGRFNSGSIDNFLKLLMVEVGYANGFDFTRVYQVFHTLHYLLYRNTIRLDLCYVREIQLNIITYYKGAVNFIQNEILKSYTTIGNTNWQNLPLLHYKKLVDINKNINKKHTKF